MILWKWGAACCAPTKKQMADLKFGHYRNEEGQPQDVGLKARLYKRLGCQGAMVLRWDAVLRRHCGRLSCYSSIENGRLWLTGSVAGLLCLSG
jgi:hypothetical protein